MWIGGLATLVVIRVAALRTLGTEENIDLFQAIGGLWGRVAGASLIMVCISGGLLAGTPRAWAGWQAACAILICGLALATAGGVLQARHLTQARRHAADHRLGREVALARVLRALIACLTIAIVVCTAWGVS